MDVTHMLSASLLQLQPRLQCVDVVDVPRFLVRGTSRLCVTSDGATVAQFFHKCHKSDGVSPSPKGGEGRSRLGLL